MLNGQPTTAQTSHWSPASDAVGAGTVFLIFAPVCFFRLAWQYGAVASTSGRLGRVRLPPVLVDAVTAVSEDAGGGRVSALELASARSVYRCLGFWAELGALLSYAWLCEKCPPVSHGARFKDSALFWGAFAMFVVFSLSNVIKDEETTTKTQTNASATVPGREEGHATTTETNTDESSSGDTLLNRAQTEEWKGWMQFLFLAYHYFHEVSIYNAVRCFISCYVWMTGFGNVSFFYIKRDFGVVRMLQMLWRLNFLVFWLCLLFGNTYILYYINPLHTFYFFVVFGSMRVLQQYNYNHWIMRGKIVVLAFVVYVVWEFPSVFESLFGVFLSRRPGLGAKSGSLHEWHFRSGLDHWSCVFGMVFALNFPAAQAWINGVEKSPRGVLRHQDHDANINANINDNDDSIEATSTLIPSKVAQSPKRGYQKAKIFLLLPLLMAFLMWAYFIYPLPKRAYNAWHPYFFFVPLLTYVVLRNFTPCLRKHHSSTLAFMGKITLETYLMQHHVWLAQNAKSLFVVVPGFPVLNLIITTMTFIYVSWRLFRLTIGLRAMHIPSTKGPQSAVVGVSAIGAVVLAAYSLSYILVRNGAGLTGFIMTFIFVCLPFLFSALFGLHRLFWSKSAETGVAGDEGDKSPVVSAAPVTAAKPATASKMPPSLIVRVVHGLLCLSILVQLGSWTKSAFFGGMGWEGQSNIFDIDDRVAAIRAKALFKSHGKDMFLPSINRKWQETQECNMFIGRREASALLRHRNVYFIGDSIGRNLMLALGRTLDPEDMETPNVSFTIEDRHADKTFTLKSGFMWSFYWSPFAAGSARRIADEVFADIANRAGSMSRKSVLVVSNGLWDMLHHGGSKGPQRFGLNAQRLALAMSKGSSSSDLVRGLWLIPTIVEPSKLASHKRNNMTVKACHEYREAVLAVDKIAELNVLDGLTFSDTSDIRELCSDGVHYENEVYDALAQGVLNTISHWEATAETATAVPVAGGQSENGAGKTKSTTCAASGGITGGGSKYLGIGYSPVLGLMVFIVIVVMLMSTDSYAGAARLALHFHDGYELGYSKMYNVAYARLKTKVQRRPTLW